MVESNDSSHELLWTALILVRKKSSLFYSLIQPEFLWGILPRSVIHSLNPAFILQHLALAARWWNHELGGARGRGNVLVSGESHPKPATRLHVTTAFVVPYLQKQQVMQSEQKS